MSEIIVQLKSELKDARKRCDEYWKLYQDLKHEIIESEGKEVYNPLSFHNLVGYTIEYDEDYCLIISAQEEGSIVSFNREFNTSKDNYNWVTEGEALITLKYNNCPHYYGEPTIIKSPCSGIFESIQNKMAKTGDLLCRIKIIPLEKKEETIQLLERNAIKQAVLQKERKKMIEREALDELIEEGKVFNVITAKNGKRMTIPSDVANAVWNRDGGRCCMCGAKEELEFDHIIPLSKGGATSFRNLQLLCKTCNIRKSDKIC